jgi:hypothetical protein
MTPRRNSLNTALKPKGKPSTAESKPLKKKSSFPGHLKSFTCTHEDIMDVKVNEIIHFDYIPDYQAETTSMNPCLIISEENVVCIEGWNLVAEAKKKKQKYLKCHIYYIKGINPLELALRKIELRCGSTWGRFNYPELIRNIKLVAALYKLEIKNFSHGGARKGKNFSDNSRIIDVMANRFNKVEETIKKQLNYSHYLKPEALEELIVMKATKRFFIKAQPQKRQLLNQLVAQKKSEEEKIIEISKYMLLWSYEFKEHKKILSVIIADETDADPEIQNPADLQLQIAPEEKTQSNYTPMEIQNHWAGNNDADTDVILTLDDIYAEHTKITENFIDISKNKPDIAELQAEYEKCIRMISDLYTSIKQLNNVASAVKGEN